MGSIVANGIPRILNLPQNTRDPRDFLRMLSPADIAAIPAFSSVMSDMPDAYDQETAGTCAGQAARRACEFLLIKMGCPKQLAALFVYWNGRSDPYTDSGASIRDIAKAAAKTGMCEEALWPYDVANVCVRPPTPAFEEGLRFQALKYTSSQSLDEVRAVISRGNGVMFGTAVYKSFFEAEATGFIPMPTADEIANGPEGYHAMFLAEQQMHTTDDSPPSTLRGYNSWGKLWGNKGTWTMPFEYWQRFCSDPTDISQIENGQEAPCEASWLSRFWRWL